MRGEVARGSSQTQGPHQRCGRGMLSGWVKVQQAGAIGRLQVPRYCHLYSVTCLVGALNTPFTSVVPMPMTVVGVSWSARVGFEDFIRVGRGAETGETAADDVDPVAVRIDARFPAASWNRGGDGPGVALDVVHLVDIERRTSSPSADGVYLIAQVAGHQTGSRCRHGRLGRPSVSLRVVDEDVVQERAVCAPAETVNPALVLHGCCA